MSRARRLVFFAALLMLTASDIRSSASAFLISAPSAELSVMDEAETASCLTDGFVHVDVGAVRYW